MNNLIHDIKKLEEAKHHLDLALGSIELEIQGLPTNIFTTQKDIQNAMNFISTVINEKKQIVDDFEKQLKQLSSFNGVVSPSRYK